MMPVPIRPKTLALGLLGAAIGGCLGYFAFSWILTQGFYALIVPPALLGAGAGLLARERSQVLAGICAIAGLLLVLFVEWRFFPFRDDGSLLFFITHLHHMKPMTLLLMAVGVFFSYRLTLGYDLLKHNDKQD